MSTYDPLCISPSRGEEERTMESVAEPNFIGTLGLNWKLFLAQLINFGIVIFVLWKWVFKPVTSALEARRKRIEESVEKAEDIEKRWQGIEGQKVEELKKAKLEAQGILKQTTEVAEKTKVEIVAEARTEAQKILNAAQQSMAREKQEMMQEMREEVGSLTVMAAEKIMREKMDEKKDRELIEGVLKSLE